MAVLFAHSLTNQSWLKLANEPRKFSARKQRQSCRLQASNCQLENPSALSLPAARKEQISSRVSLTSRTQLATLCVERRRSKLAKAETKKRHSKAANTKPLKSASQRNEATKRNLQINEPMKSCFARKQAYKKLLFKRRFLNSFFLRCSFELRASLLRRMLRRTPIARAIRASKANLAQIRSNLLSKSRTQLANGSRSAQWRLVAAVAFACIRIRRRATQAALAPLTRYITSLHLSLDASFGGVAQVSLRARLSANLFRHCCCCARDSFKSRLRQATFSLSLH